MRVTVNNGAIEFDNASMSAIDGTKDVMPKEMSSDSVPADILEKAGYRPVYSITVGDVHDFGEGTLTIRIAYTLLPGEDPSKLTMWHYLDDGTYVEKDCTYDDGYLVFTTNKLSYFSLMHGSEEPEGSVWNFNKEGANGILFAALLIITVLYALYVRRA
ncbi:MAG: hypothetical protein ACI4Q9_01745 [Candidatus Methanomethylophilaceae archaeon]